MNTIDLKELAQKPTLDIIIEAILFSANEGMPLKKIQEAVGAQYDTLEIEEALEGLKTHWQNRGLQLINTATGYRFCTKLNMQIFVERAQNSRPPRYAKSVIETLAVIAYRQPVTRADIENIRGVAVNSLAIKTLEARGWIEAVGIKKDSPGQPQLWGTTKKFLSDLAIQKLADLPPLSAIAEALENQINAEKSQIDISQNTLPIAELLDDNAKSANISGNIN